MKAQKQWMKASLVALVILPLTCGAANAQNLGSLLGQQAKSVAQQTKGDAQGIGTVDVTHPTQIPGQLVSNAKTAALQAQLQAEETAVQKEQAAIAVQEAQIASLQAQIDGN